MITFLAKSSYKNKNINFFSYTFFSKHEKYSIIVLEICYGGIKYERY